jgi:predicted transposase YbfD/YdcC
MKILESISNISDPRMSGKVIHPLSSIIFTALCGVLSGCESWDDISDYCSIKYPWLSQYVDLSNGIPSSYTFRRLFTILSPDSIELLLRSHAADIVALKGNSDQIAIDGKALRGSKSKGLQCLYSVSAWCHENSLVLAEVQTESKSNEIAAIPLLLDSLNIKGSTITIDAAGCQKQIVQSIVDKKGFYVLGLKRNNPKFYDLVEKHIASVGESNNNRLFDEFDNSHGRSTRRRYFGYDIRKIGEAVESWSGAKTVIAVETISSKINDANNKVTAEWRYYLSNHDFKNPDLPKYVRNHWGIENKLHWMLDVHLKEDSDQKAERNSARSFSILRRIALNIVKTKDLTPKRSTRRKLKRSGWDNNYLLEMLA